MFNETTGAGPATSMVYNPTLLSRQYRTRQSRRGQACCARCAQQGLSGCGCSPTEVIVIQEPTSEQQSTSTATATEIPRWMLLVALGVGAILILKK